MKFGTADESAGVHPHQGRRTQEIENPVSQPHRYIFLPPALPEPLPIIEESLGILWG